MSSDGITKRSKTSSERRKTAALKIKLLGIELLDMGRCTPCQNSGSACYILKGHKKCSSCEHKDNRRCDGTFSELEFDTLEAKKREAQKDAQEKRAEVGRRAAAAAQAYADLAKAQQEEIELQAKIDRYTENQSRMLRQELALLDKLDGLPADSVVGFGDQVLPWGDPSTFMSPDFSGLNAGPSEIDDVGGILRSGRL